MAAVQEIERHSEELDRLILRQMRDELESYYLQAFDHESQQRDSRARIGALQEEAQNLERRLRKRENELTAMRSSLSWRITGPLRWLVGGLIGR